PSVEAFEDRTVPNSTPVANADFVELANPGPAPIDVLENDAAPAGINPTTVSVVRSPQFGAGSVNPSTAGAPYTDPAGSSDTDTSADPPREHAGVTSHAPAVRVVLGARRANASPAEPDAGTPVALNVRENDASPGSALVPSSVHVVTGPSHGTFSINTANGE